MKLILALIGSVVAVQAASISVDQKFGTDLKAENENFDDYETVQVSTDLLSNLHKKINKMYTPAGTVA